MNVDFQVDSLKDVCERGAAGPGAELASEVSAKNQLFAKTGSGGEQKPGH